MMTLVQRSQGSAYIFSRNRGGTNAWGRVKKLVASGSEITLVAQWHQWKYSRGGGLGDDNGTNINQVRLYF